MTNMEQIQQMSKEELAKFLCQAFEAGCDGCPAYKYCYKGHNGMQEWLEEDK